MNLVFISLMLLTVIQQVVCGFSWPLLFSYIGRVLFLMRLIGSVIPIKVSLVFEGIHLFIVLLIIVMTGTSDDWVVTGLTVLFCALSALLQVIDNAFYLYVVEDEKEEE